MAVFSVACPYCGAPAVGGRISDYVAVYKAHCGYVVRAAMSGDTYPGECRVGTPEWGAFEAALQEYQPLWDLVALRVASDGACRGFNQVLKAYMEALEGRSPWWRLDLRWAQMRNISRLRDEVAAARSRWHQVAHETNARGEQELARYQRYQAELLNQFWPGR
jgi:hypothetical protein